MAAQIYGTKVGMTRVFDGDIAVPVTVIQCQPNEVVEIKTADKHGQNALKVGVGPRRRKPTKSIAGEFKKADVAARRFLRDVPVPTDGKGKPAIDVKLGAQLTVAVLDKGKLCDVVGRNKGRGFAGTMKRHNFSGQMTSHGQMGPRTPGAIGARMDPGRTFPGQRMAGHWGDEQVTIKNLKIVSIDPEQHLVVVRGAIPGPNGGLVSIKQA